MIMSWLGRRLPRSGSVLARELTGPQSDTRRAKRAWGAQKLASRAQGSSHQPHEQAAAQSLKLDVSTGRVNLCSRLLRLPRLRRLARRCRGAPLPLVAVTRHGDPPAPAAIPACSRGTMPRAGMALLERGRSPAGQAAWHDGVDVCL